MGSNGNLTLSEAAEFLQMSRPTFNKRRQQYNFPELNDGTSILISKNELLDAYASEVSARPTTNLVISESDKLDEIFVDENTIDLRKIDVIDAYGTISLVTAVTQLLEDGHLVYLIIENSFTVRFLKYAGFFNELLRRFPSRVFWNASEWLETLGEDGEKPFLPLRYLAYKGQERKMLEEIVPLLQQQGFEEETIGHVNWVIGELADNSLTHAQGPCYVLMGQFKATDNYFQIAIGDTGKGIFNSLKTNSKYSKLSDKQAMLKAFESKVTSWSDDVKRGKGLCDLLVVAIGNGSMVRADAKDVGLLFNFSSGQKELIWRRPTTKLGGTRFCLLMINDKFKDVSREEVDTFIESELNKYEKN